MQYSICISGAADGKSVERSSDHAYQVGKLIAEAGHVTTTGATVGLPFYGAKGARDHGGLSIGFSPATNLIEHVRKYRLPTSVFDYINFTGMDYIGRDLHLVQSSEALITVGGRFGSLHEFVIALQTGKPCGVLLETGGTADIIPELLDKLEEPPASRVVLDSDPVKLVAAIIKLLDKDYRHFTPQELARHEAEFDKLAGSNHAG